MIIKKNQIIELSEFQKLCVILKLKEPGSDMNS